jgi:glycosyltransferase involved in cell wall biosynthesis
MINRFFLKRLAGVIVLDGMLVSMFRGLVIERRIFIVKNSVDPLLFRTSEEIRGKFTCGGSLRILFLSNMIQTKGYNELLDGWLRISPEQRAFVELDFAGAFEDNWIEVTFRKRIAGLAGVRYHGVVTGEKKKNLLSRAHVLALPSIYPYEGQPIAILEAYASGCVVMASSQGGIPGVFSCGVNGWSLEYPFSDSIRRAIIEAKDDFNLLLRYALSNRLLAEIEFSLKKQLNALERAIFRCRGSIEHEAVNSKDYSYKTHN